jgi:hypothetical protein
MRTNAVAVEKIDFLFRQHAYPSAWLRMIHPDHLGDEATGPIAIQLQRVCHDTLPGLISVSLGHMNAVSRYLD